MGYIVSVAISLLMEHSHSGCPTMTYWRCSYAVLHLRATLVLIKETENVVKVNLILD